MKLTVIIPVYNQEELIKRALDSIPKRDDIEIIVIDDCSTDNTWNVLEQNLRQNMTIIKNAENKGVGYTVNKGYDLAKGDYIVLLGSDDYFYTDNFEAVLEELDGTDLIYFDIQINNGDIWRTSKENKVKMCGSVKFMKRKFIGDTRCPEIRVAEDLAFYKELLKKKPTEKFTHAVIKHYNFPRQGSLTNSVEQNT